MPHSSAGVTWSPPLAAATATPDRENDGATLAGGRALETPFGIFYSPNITPDPVTGIGRWSLAELSRALRQGRSPQGEHYYPSFPYTSYTGISDADVADMWSYLQSVEPVQQPNRPHALPWYLQYRPLLLLWKLLNFASAQGPPQAASAGGAMAEVIDHSTGQLSPEDCAAIAAHLRSLPALPGEAAP